MPAACASDGVVSAEEQLRIAERVRAACVRAALEGYEMAGISGLCHEGAWELAVDAVRSLDLEAVLREAEGEIGEPSGRRPD